MKKTVTKPRNGIVIGNVITVFKALFRALMEYAIVLYKENKNGLFKFLHIPKC